MRAEARSCPHQSTHTTFCNYSTKQCPKSLILNQISNSRFYKQNISFLRQPDVRLRMSWIRHNQIRLTTRSGIQYPIGLRLEDVLRILVQHL